MQYNLGMTRIIASRMFLCSNGSQILTLDYHVTANEVHSSVQYKKLHNG